METIFRVTGPLSGESTAERWIPLTKASRAELWWFLWSAPQYKTEQTIGMPVIWNAIAVIITPLQLEFNYKVHIKFTIPHINPKYGKLKLCLSLHTTWYVVVDDY